MMAMGRYAVFALVIAMGTGCGKDEKSNSKQAYDDYMIKARNTEAREMLKKLWAGARAYYLEEHLASGSIAPVSKAFPTPSAGPTPPLGSCCKNPDKKCIADPAMWSKPPWTALRFALEEPFFFSYTYEVKGKQVTVRANGDLDCDGVYSTFELSGGVDPDMSEDPVSTGSLRIVQPKE